MPELPEVQAHAERLTAEFGGAVLSKFVPLAFHALKTAVPAPGGRARASRCADVGRRGKYLLLDFERADLRRAPDAGRAAQARREAGGRAEGRPGALDLRRRPRPDAHRAGHRTASGRLGGGDRRGARSAPGRRPRPRGAGVTPEDAGGAVRRPPDAAAHVPPRPGGASPGWAGDWPTRSATGPSSRRSHRPASSASTAPPRRRGRHPDAVEEGLAYERSRPDMSSSADRPGGVHHRTGEPCPVCDDTVREVSYSPSTRSTTARRARPAARCSPTTPRASSSSSRPPQCGAAYADASYRPLRHLTRTRTPPEGAE